MPTAMPTAGGAVPGAAGAGPADGAPGAGPPARPGRRRALLAALVAVLLLAGAAGALFVLRPGPVAGWLADAAPSASPSADPPEPTPPPVLVAAEGQAPAPTAAGVQAAIGALVTDSVLGSKVNISVVDVATGQSLYARQPQSPTVPASTTKLVTAATVLAARGPAYRIATRAVAGAEPGVVVLVGGGDPTLARGASGAYPGAARLDQLAEQVKKALGGTAPTRVVVDSALFPAPNTGPGWDSDAATGGYASVITALMTDGARVDPKKRDSPTPRQPTPDLAAGQAFARALGLPASAVQRGRAPEPVTGASTGVQPSATAQPAASGAPVAAGVELARVESPPMVRLVEMMLVDSDNVLAEALARQVALAKGQPGSFAGAASAMDAVLTELGLPEAQSSLVDGSGLSRTNRVTPELLTGLLTAAASGRHPQLSGLFTGLPVAAWSGTLKDRYADPAGGGRAGAGIVRAKTGTLSGVNAISGVVVTAQGRLLAFAVLANDVPVGQLAAQPALDRIAAKLATCGCR